jgi:hypothetical protein
MLNLTTVWKIKIVKQAIFKVANKNFPLAKTIKQMYNYFIKAGD